ncbi:alpha/beta fold hydrolase [Streptomyces griseoluteus]|uniref:alpha/beta fold hydrolase n=1 Tax=Streptomyces griseoluteus TaxID=29306 RepID=UPI0036F8903C
MLILLRPDTHSSGGRTTAYLHAGHADAPLALLLHGFPDTPHSWNPLAEGLVEAGFRVVAPWLRGYAPSSPAADGDYGPSAHVSDVAALAQVMGADEHTLLIGHDIGAAIAYAAALRHPNLFGRVATLSVPPPPALSAVMTSYAQLKRSWYTFAFQHPAAEELIGADNFAFLRGLWTDWSPRLDPTPHLDHLHAALPDREHLSAALGWYRAVFQPTPPDQALATEQAAAGGRVPMPWLYLHGTDDGCVGAEALQYVPGGVPLHGVGHFPQLEAPREVVIHLRKFLESDG